MWYDSFINFFGVYSPIVHTSDVLLSDGTPSTVVEVSTDWGYILSVLLFSLVLFCLMKMLGGVLHRGR